ncbi:EamA family transporter [Candidatus Peregrinibacteria bacterium]|nr:EamA family transporter [Candidatus Peregrinibacteria bacterium]
MISWGLGDFFIQRTVRLIGSTKALFCIAITGTIVLFPFVWRELLLLDMPDLLLLSLLTFVVIVSALFNFEALKTGKIAIIEPIIGLELPITVALSISLAHETLSPSQWLLIVIVFIGITSATTLQYSHLHYHKRIFEKGAILAGLAAIGMGLTNFLVGISSREISPLLTIWFSHTGIALIIGTYLLITHTLIDLYRDVCKHPWPVMSQSFLDNIAWIAFAFATTFIPIAVATAISESYLALAVLLGLLVTREKIKNHQKAGVAMAVSGVILLSGIS